MDQGVSSHSGPTGQNSSCGSSSDDVDEDSPLDNTDFVRNHKERSTVLVRRYFKNNKKVIICLLLHFT